MTHYHAQINRDGTAFNVGQSEVKVIGEDIIELISFDVSVLGRRWNGRAWEDCLQTPQPRHISHRAFRARFTQVERIAIEWAAVDKPDASEDVRMRAAALRSDLKDQEQAAFIDLDSEQTVRSVRQLEAFGLIAPGRADLILDALVQPEEKL